MVVAANGQAPLLLDLGTGISSIASVGAYAKPGEGFRGTALVTHLHYDHVLGLPFFTPVNHPDARLDVFGPRQPDGSLADAFAALVRPPYFPIHLGDLRGDICFRDLSAESFSVGSFRVTSRLVPHVGPTLGYRIEFDGKVLCYISDHQAPPDLHSIADVVLELCDGADLLIHDAQYTVSEFRAKPDWGHSTAGYALHVAREAGVKRLCLYHHDPSHIDDDIDRMLEAVRSPADAAGIAVVAAAENLAVTL
ncbi:MAG TPA: MBL fold metallo-hydrolase [Acidimicrobiales bacterium]|nr:MBL fold metallo-hydrolase [Acidimicrobiales bacterium]